jgi:formylmethanofuran:tetrahydromethanopterin formyltransferase
MAGEDRDDGGVIIGLQLFVLILAGVGGGGYFLFAQRQRAAREAERMAVEAARDAAAAREAAIKAAKQAEAAKGP